MEQETEQEQENTKDEDLNNYEDAVFEVNEEEAKLFQ